MNKYLDNVRTQYEQYPYPPRNPEDEQQRLIEIAIDQLSIINFYCFKGKQSFENVNILVAGGGTGDSTIFLAEQLRDKNSKVVYVDISKHSMAIAQQRAQKRKLTNIQWVHGSILSLSEYNLGLFDYISCTGVLHHLNDPKHGLHTLKSVLKPTGAMGIMLYGKYGRSGVYQMQELMRLINQKSTTLPEKIKNTRTVLDELPESNWFQHNQNFISDHDKLGDNGLVDLLLHEQDRSYSIDEIYQLLDSVNLRLVEFSSVKMRLSYRPEQYIQNKELISQIKKLSVRKQQHIAELLVGAFKKHEFFVSEKNNTKADFNDLNNIPFFHPHKTYHSLGQRISNQIAKQSSNHIALKHSSGYEFDLAADQLNYHFFKNINGEITLIEIFNKIRTGINGCKLTNSEISKHLFPSYYKFEQLDWLLLKSQA